MLYNEQSLRRWRNQTDPWFKATQKWILALRNQNTSRQYTTYQKQFRTFCSKYGRTLVPAAPATVAMFLRVLLQKGKSRSTIKAARSAISDLHRQEGFESPTLHSLVQQATMVITLLTPPLQSASAFSVEMFRDLIKVYRTRSTLDTRDLFLLLIMLTGMLRSDEAVNLREEDVWIENFEGQDVLFIFVEKSKNDQERIGHTRVVSGASDPLICPLAWFLRCCQKRKKGTRRFFTSNAGKSLSSKTVSSILKRWLARADLSPVGFSSHSLRRGGATAAAAGVVRRLLQRHGNWKSSAVDIYITDSMDLRLSSSGNLQGSLHLLFFSLWHGERLFTIN